MKKIKFIGLIILFSISIGVVNAKNETWLRLEHPNTQLLNDLPKSAVNYGNFVWVNESQISFQHREYAQNEVVFSNPYNLIVGDQSFDPVDETLEDTLWFNDLSSNEKGFYIVQFVGPMKPEWLDQLKQLGIKPLKAMAPFSYIVWANAQMIEQSQNLTTVRWGGYFYSAFRVQSANRNLSPDITPTMALIYHEDQEVTLNAMKNIGAYAITVQKIDSNFDAVTFKMAGNLYSELSRLSGLLTVQQIPQDAGSRGEMSQQSIVGNYDMNNTIFPGYQSWLDAAGLDGTGVTVGVVDGGIFENHPDLTDNMIACTGLGPSCGNSTDSHGTHVAGAIAGSAASGTTDSNGFLRGQGVAPGTSIVEQLYSPLLGGGPGGMVAGGMLSIYKDSSVSGAMLTNNSWGPTGTPQGYDIPTMEIDMISRDADPDTIGAQPVLAVWSIMNGNGDSGGNCSPSSLGSPDEAKNLFAVGSTKMQTGSGNQIAEIFDVSANSAHGPACDGRQVPHIVAPGCSTDSPDSATGYGFKCGTSMASPVISGSVSLFWQWYKSTFLIDPSPAMVKATFTAVAKNLSGFEDADGGIMGNAPDRKQGWGRVDLDSVINPDTNVLFYDQQFIMTATGQQWSQEFEADNATKPVRLMLVWTDAPGAGLGGTTPAWINDLDLSLATMADTYLGNVFGVDGFSASGGVVDSMNNMEGLFVKANQHNGNSFTVSVLAANIAADALNPHIPGTPAQDFALVCYNCKEYVDVGLIYKDSFEN